jgi:hypothetical protein
MGHPLYSNCRTPPKFRAPRDEIKMPTIPDLLRIRKTVEASVSETTQVPSRIVNFDHTGLIAFDLGHIAHPIRRFDGGGPYRFSQTNGAENYSEKVFVDTPGSAGIRQARSDGRAQRGAGCTFFATHTRFDRHDAAFSVSNLEKQDDSSRRAAKTVRTKAATFNWGLIAGKSAGV